MLGKNISYQPKHNFKIIMTLSKNISCQPKHSSARYDIYLGSKNCKFEFTQFTCYAKI